MRHHTGIATRNSAGTVLPMTMAVVALAAMTSVTLLFRSRAEVCASSTGQKSQQAYAAAMSGVRSAISVVYKSRESIETWYDNPELFRNQIVSTDGNETWYFTVYAPNPNDKTAVRYGVIDESGKININVADEQTLLGLPGMDQELTDCLLDWRDKDDETRSNGAEQEYYSSLRPISYRIKNAMLMTLEELMLVKGFNASVIYGEDANLNGVLDANEDDTEESFPIDDGLTFLVFADPQAVSDNLDVGFGRDWVVGAFAHGPGSRSGQLRRNPLRLFALAGHAHLKKPKLHRAAQF